MTKVAGSGVSVMMGRTLRFFLMAALLAAKQAPVDINSATIEQLETLPGIEEGRAKAIVKGRPYANKGQLLGRGIVSAGEYRAIRDLIIARQ